MIDATGKLLELINESFTDYSAELLDEFSAYYRADDKYKFKNSENSLNERFVINIKDDEYIVYIGIRAKKLSPIYYNENEQKILNLLVNNIKETYTKLQQKYNIDNQLIITNDYYIHIDGKKIAWNLYLSISKL